MQWHSGVLDNLSHVSETASGHLHSLQVGRRRSLLAALLLPSSFDEREPLRASFLPQGSFRVDSY